MAHVVTSEMATGRDTSVNESRSRWKRVRSGGHPRPLLAKGRLSTAPDRLARDDLVFTWPEGSVIHPQRLSK
jgi:hypothetical protein